MPTATRRTDLHPRKKALLTTPLRSRVSGVMSGRPGALEKERRTPLEKGYSLQSWMRLSADADLSGGVGKVDEDEDEENWKVWPMAEVRKHNSREDFWTVVRGRVYNLTPYLLYHPGGIKILGPVAGTDGTVLFDK